MTFFVDANVIVYSAIPSDYRRPCLELLRHCCLFERARELRRVDDFQRLQDGQPDFKRFLTDAPDFDLLEIERLVKAGRAVDL